MAQTPEHSQSDPEPYTDRCPQCDQLTFEETCPYCRCGYAHRMAKGNQAGEFS